MTEHLLYQERFDGDVRPARDAYGNPIPEIDEVDGWEPFWLDGDGYHKPEMKRIDASNPNYAQPVNRLNEVGYGLKAFKQWGHIDCGWRKQFSIPSIIDELTIELRGHCWYSQGDDPTRSEYKRDGELVPCDGGMRLWIGVDLDGDTDPDAGKVQWQHAEIFDGHCAVPLDLHESAPRITVFIAADNDHQFKHVDAYFAEVNVFGYDDAEPPGEECRGLPREDYVRIYNVIPTDATDERAAEIAAIAWARGKQTVGGSYDDAGIGDLSDKTAVLWDIDEVHQADFEDFYKTHYPGTKIVFEGSGIGGIEPPEEPPSEPQYELPTRNLIGLHMQNPKTDWPVYVREAKPAVYKAVNQLGMVIEAKQAYPDALTVYRFHVHNDGAWLDTGDLRASALRFLDLYSGDFDTHAANTGMSVADVLGYVDVIETINEVIGHDYERNLRAVEFDCHFADAVRERYGHAVDAGLLTVAIGNPPEDQVQWLLPAARKAYEDGHWLAYHAYWTANRLRPEPPYLLRHWDYHAGRWMRWDDLFRSHDIYPRYYLGEGGIVFARDEGGIDFSYGEGWKSCGSFDYYIQQLAMFNDLVLDWNAEHGNRCRGLTVFCYGGGGWADFDFEPGDLYALRDWAVTL